MPRKPAPPRFSYPAAPHIIGMDWIELAVASPRRTAELLIALGFSPRGHVGAHPTVAVGGTVYMLKRGKPRPAGGPAWMTIQLTTDHIAQKRQHLLDLGMTPGPLRRQPRGDMTFLWSSPDGYALRFVGPVR